MAIENQLKSSDEAQIPAKAMESMDIPKITVFKSPPWNKPVKAAIPKIVDLYEEFPFKSRNVKHKVSMSLSLECIPENSILKDINTNTLSHLKESNRLSPHAILPPILRGNDDLPEMRQRAYSDPNKYTAIIKKRVEEKKESPLIKPSKEKVVKEPAGLLKSKVNSSTDKPSGCIKKDYVLPKTPEKHSSCLKSSTEKLSHKNGNKNVDSDKYSLPTPEEKSRTAKKQALKNANEHSLTHPSVTTLRDSEPRGRTNSLPGNLTDDLLNRSAVTSPARLKTTQGVKKSSAYALVGSPGRERWPSPYRDVTSYIQPVSDNSSSPDSTRTSSNESVAESSTSKKSSEILKPPVKDYKTSERSKNISKS